METGDEAWHIPPEGRISTSPDWGRGQQAQSTDPMVMIIASESGVIRAHDATSTREFWTVRLDAAVKSSPVVAGENAVVATEDGFVYGFDLQAGGDGPLWRFPEGDEGLGFVSADLTYDDGMLYVGTREGLLWMIDVSSETPTEICRFDAENPIVANPVVADGIVYVSTTGQTTWTLSPGICETNTVTGRLFQYAEDYPVDNAPAVVGDIMYLPQWRYLYGKNLATNSPLWDAGALAVAEAQLTTPPVVAGDMVYFASADGIVHALDATTGETQWTWDAGVVIRSAPAVIDGVVFIATTDGYVYAVGP
jgi:outer membrane protein assembly factor BamB